MLYVAKAISDLIGKVGLSYPLLLNGLLSTGFFFKLVDHVGNGFLIESRPTAVREKFSGRVHVTQDDDKTKVD